MILLQKGHFALRQFVSVKVGGIGKNVLNNPIFLTETL
jgi:hypothetical protein